MVWFKGNGEIPAAWVHEDEFLPGEYLPVEVETDGGLDYYVRVPADEPASKADLMSVAADVASLSEQLQRVTTRLEDASAALNMRRSSR